MSRNRLIIIGVSLAAIIIVVGIVFLRPQPESQPSNLPTSGAQTGQGGTPSETQTRTPVPADVTAPVVGQQVASSVAPPQVVTPANSHTASQLRSFTITANHNAFTPSTIIVNQGDIVNIVVSAVDKNYDFTQPDYGFKQAIPKGQSKQIQFGATASGKFSFYCASCGGPSAGPIGYIEIIGK